MIGASGVNKMFVFHGSQSGLPSVASRTITGLPGSGFGYQVDDASDVDLDGFGDVVVGAPNYNGKGVVYIYFGDTTGLSQIASWSRNGTQVDGSFAYVVAGAGDLNHDLYQDILVAAPTFTAGESSEGAVFMYLGGPLGMASPTGL